MVTLSNRLQLVADCVNPCVTLADIGTDHAYLPVYCIQQAKVRFAIAADINPNPLKNARNTLAENGLIEEVELRLSDGLSEIDPQEVDEIVIAGMGGNQIADMIHETAWLQDVSKHLVLQPMTHFEDVRQALLEHQFTIEAERTTQEGDHLYLVISARYSGEEQATYPGYLYGGTLVQSQAPTDCAFLDKALARLQKRAEALQASEPDTSAELFAMIKGITDERRKFI